MFRPGSSSSGRSSPGGGQDGLSARIDEIGREQRAEEHDLRRDPELDAEQHVGSRGDRILGVTDRRVLGGRVAGHGFGCSPEVPGSGTGGAVGTVIGGDPYW